MLIVKVPGINGLGKTKGTRNSGNAVISCLNEIHSNEKDKIVERNLLDLEEIHVDNNNLEQQEKLIYENARKIFNQDKVIFLGGDHSISYSIGKAFLDYCQEENKEACLIVFDAHADCMKPVKNPTNEEWLRALIEHGFHKENVLLVGIRNLWRQEIKFLAENKIKKISMDELNNNLEETTDLIMEFASGKQAYVSFDIDVIEPVFASSTSHPEAGGLTPRQIIYIFSRLSRMRNLKVFDLVEVDSENDLKKEGLTVKLAAKLLAELL